MTGALACRRRRSTAARSDRGIALVEILILLGAALAVIAVVTGMGDSLEEKFDCQAMSIDGIGAGGGGGCADVGAGAAGVTSRPSAGTDPAAATSAPLFIAPGVIATGSSAATVGGGSGNRLVRTSSNASSAGRPQVTTASVGGGFARLLGGVLDFLIPPASAAVEVGPVPTGPNEPGGMLGGQTFDDWVHDVTDGQAHVENISASVVVDANTQLTDSLRTDDDTRVSLNVDRESVDLWFSRPAVVDLPLPLNDHGLTHGRVDYNSATVSVDAIPLRDSWGVGDISGIVSRRTEGIVRAALGDTPLSVPGYDPFDDAGFGQWAGGDTDWSDLIARSSRTSASVDLVLDRDFVYDSNGEGYALRIPAGQRVRITVQTEGRLAGVTGAASLQEALEAADFNNIIIETEAIVSKDGDEVIQLDQVMIDRDGDIEILRYTPRGSSLTAVGVETGLRLLFAVLSGAASDPRMAEHISGPTIIPGIIDRMLQDAAREASSWLRNLLRERGDQILPGVDLGRIVR